MALSIIFLEAAIATFSIKAFEIPMALIGYAALSVLRQIIFLTPFAIAASIVFWVPNTFVLAASSGKQARAFPWMSILILSSDRRARLPPPACFP